MQRNVLHGTGRVLAAGVMLGGATLVGGAIWGGLTLAGAGAVTPTLNCDVSGSVLFDAGGGPGSGALYLNSNPGNPKAVTETAINNGANSLLLESGGVPGQTILVGKQTVTITSSSVGTSGYTLGITPEVTGLKAPIAAGKTVNIEPTTSGSGAFAGYTTAYSATVNTKDWNVSGSSCTSTTDIWPNSVGLDITGSNGGNSAAGLETVPALAGSVVYPSATGYTVNGTAPTFSFTSKDGTFNEETGTYAYTKGVVTGTYASKAATASVSLTGVTVCTEDQLIAVEEHGENPLAVCDGGSSSSVSPADAAAELEGAEGGGSANGSDGSPLLAIFKIDLGGSTSL